MREEQFGISRGNIKSKQNLIKIARAANRVNRKKVRGMDSNHNESDYCMHERVKGL